MKRLLVLFLMISVNTFSQDVPLKIVEMIVKYNVDSTIALVQKGKKKGVYCIASNEYILELTKDEIFIFPIDNLVFRINKEGEIYPYRWDQDVLKESKIQDHMCDTLDAYRYYFRDYNLRYLGTNKDGDYIADQQNPSQGSGIFNHHTKNWEIPPQYSSIYRASDDYMLAQKFDSIWWAKPNDDLDNGFRLAMHYDIYKMGEEGYILTHKNISSFAELPLNDIYKIDSIQQLTNDIYYSFKKGRRGILLGSKFQYQDIGGFQKPVTEIFEPKYNYIIEKPYSNRYITVDPTQEDPVIEWEVLYTSYGRYQKTKLRSHPTVLLTEEPQRPRPSYQALLKRDSIDCQELEFELDRGYGLEHINDTLVKIINRNKGDLIALMSIEYGGEDSIDWEGNVVYTVENQFSSSGVWDTKNNRWEVDTAAYDFYIGDDYAIYHYLELDESQNGVKPYYNEMVLVVDNKYGPIKTDVLFSDFVNDGSNLMYFYPKESIRSIETVGSEDIETLLVSYGVESMREAQMIDYRNLECGFQVIKNNGLMDLVYPGNYGVQPYIIVENKEFAMSELRASWIFTIDGDQMSFDLPDTTIVFSDKQEFSFNQKYLGDNGNVLTMIEIISEEDTVYTEWEKEAANNDLSKNLFSVKKEEDLLIINNCPTSEWAVYDPEYYELVEYITQEKERSAIWRQTDTGYVRVTPFYAEIIPNSFGYIVRTGKFSGYPEFNYNSWTAEYSAARESRYLLLNKEFKAVNFLDVFDYKGIHDLGFGIQLNTDKGGMFVDYEGNAITNDEWDAFEIEDGKLKAMNLRPLVDEFGEFLYFEEEGKLIDWDGNEVDPIEKFQYFELKK